MCKKTASNDIMDKPTIPLETIANKYTNLTYGWMGPLIKRATKKKNLTPNDLYPAHEHMTSRYCGEQFALSWNRQRWNFMLKGKDQMPTVMPTIFKAFIGRGKLLFILLPFYFTSSVIAPITIQFLIRCIQNVQQNSPVLDFFYSQYFGFALCGIVLLCQILYAFLDTVITTFAYKMSTQGFQSLQDILYLKMMKIKANNSQMKDVTNLLFTDSFKIQSSIQYFPYLILYTLQVLFVIVYLIILLNYYSVIGIGIMLIFLPIMIVVSNKNVTVQRVLLGYRDSRVGKVQEVLQGVKMIKYFRTELVTEQKLANIRRKELQVLTKYGTVLIGVNMLTQAANLIMCAVTFSMLYFFGKSVKPGEIYYFTTQNIYTIIYLYDFLNNLLLNLPLMFAQALEAGISGKRIGAFLLMPEIDIGLITYHNTDYKSQFQSNRENMNNINEGGEEGEETEEAERKKHMQQPKNNIFTNAIEEDYIVQVTNLPSFTYAISEDLVIPPVLDTDFALHRDKVQKIMRQYDVYVDLYNSAYEQFFDMVNADQRSDVFQAIKADCEILKRGPCFDYFKNQDNNPRKIITGDHQTFNQRKKRGELETQKFKRLSHELVATLLDNWCLELDVIPISKIENLGSYDEGKLTRRYEFDSDIDFLRRMYVNLRITTPYYMRFKLQIEQETEDLAPSIRDLDLNIQRGQLIGVCGAVGAGKSTLFNALTGEMRLERIQRKILQKDDNIIRFYEKEKTYSFVDSSKVDLTKLKKIVDKKFKIDNTIKKKNEDDSSSSSEFGRQKEEEEIPPPKVDIYAKKIAYFTQVPVIYAGTIRHNIQFYQPFDEDKYTMVISLCCLLRDFEEWPEGDMFNVGFDGVGLSGGQKARVSLARALYYQPDLLFLDDPLSAVDAFVSKFLWQELICGYCRANKITVLISSHQTQFFGDCDRILYLEQGIVLFDGSVEELAGYTGGNVKQTEWSENGTNAMQRPMQDNNIKLRTREAPPEFDVSRHINVEYRSKPPRINPLLAQLNAPAERPKAGTYKEYLKQGGMCLTVMFIMMLFVQYAGKIFLQIFIGFWAQNRISELNETPDVYMYTYAAVSAATLFFNFFSLFAFIRLAINAARQLHANMTRSIIRTKLSFFDITQNGTIVNRFTKDTESIDVSMMQQLLQLAVNVMGLITLVFIFAINVPSGIVIIPVLVVYFYYFKIFRILTPALKKLDLNLKGPIISQSNETMRSLSTIRCMKFQSTFSNVYRGKVDNNVQAQYPNACCVRWLTYRMYLLCSLISTAVCLSSVIFSSIDFEYMRYFSVVSVSYCFGIQQFLINFILAFVQIEAEAISVERVLDYTKLEREGKYKSNRELPETWPKKGGAIEIKNLHFRYRAELPCVIKGLSFDVKPYEHVGIVGRTGCAKSTFTMALFRVNDPDEGSKLVFDGVNILDDVGLHASRKGLSIVPQDPFVFSGTLRTTLDKAAELHQEGLDSDEYVMLPDSALWEVLDRVNLGDYFRRTPGGLDSKITANATNLSIGQKQLLIFAASLISNSFCVIMDEATSQVDKANDQMVQDLIREQLNDRIIFSIAHRLDTVIEFDRVLVMDAGQLVEFDRPTTLLRRKGHFYSLCKNTGHENFCRLKQMALSMERRRFPELGIIDGIDDDFDDGVAENPELIAAQVKEANARQKIAEALFDDNGEDEEEWEEYEEWEEEEQQENSVVQEGGKILNEQEIAKKD